jgi:outer membrane receptor protein involved in Fe transport
MVRSLLLTLTILLFGSAAVVAQTFLTGKVTDPTTSEDLIGASVKVLKGTALVRGAITDVNGEFRIPLDPGQYDVEVSYTGYTANRLNGVQVLAGELNSVNFEMNSNTTLNTVEITTFKVDLVKADQTSGGKTLTSEQIKNLPTRSVNAIVATTAGTSSIDGGAVTIKGSRSNATNYYIDGVRVFGSVPPVQDIEQLQVITGGIGAEYGDVTGGVISILTKGPASDFSGYAEVENSNGLDPYGWLLATANISGPLWKRKSADGTRERTVIGFRLSGQYNTQKDDDPPATRVARAKGKFLGSDAAFGSQFEEGSVLDHLQQHPLTRTRGVITNTAENYTQDSVDLLRYRPFEGRKDIDFTGKLDFRFTDAIDLNITGTYKNTTDQFTPTGTGGFSDTNWRLLNSHNNPTQYDSRRRVIGRLRHRLGNPEKEAENKNKVAISNASYQIQFGFERSNGTVYDPRHKDNFFDYGYVGKFNYAVDTIIFPVGSELLHLGYFERFTGYQSGGLNPGLEAYNEFANPENINTFLTQNGRFSTVYDDIWSGMHANVNRGYNRYQKDETDIITLNASSNFDLKLGKTGVHNIQFGLLNEQRTVRNWDLAPYSLWDLARQLANRRYNGLDTSLVIDTKIVNGIPVDIYGYLLAEKGDGRFFNELRNKLGVSEQTWVNPLSLTPDQLSLDMFSAFELTDLDGGRLSYYGYDYLGNKLGGGYTFNDFFTHRGADGIRDFPVAPLTPIYQAAYIKDKFTFNKMIFSLGMRVERFDLNTRVMKDRYSLYNIMDANTYFNKYDGTRPGNIGDDYKVYTTNGYADISPVAFRDGNTWYSKDGVQVNDATLIFGGGVISPILADTVNGDDIRKDGFDPNSAFEDYTPQINWLPRLAFSFPINKDANFFAHYDVLVQRPPSNWEVTPLDYYYFYVAGRTPTNNANLRPERVVDYEVGFQQKLNQNSALKFSAYYREMRDMIQERVVLYIPVIGRYSTTDNIDFGTVKGFTTQYDLRRIKNIELQLSYTLQFADGTGSNSTSQRGLRQQLRTLYPLEFDERHSINGIFDYRFDEGKRYNGPQVAGRDILANFGINLQFNAVSGRPYTARRRAERFGASGNLGTINGNRLPWRSNIDLRIDKTFNLTAAGRRPLNMNVYFRVANLLDRRNVTSVFAYTGSPTDDGYLATAEGQSSISGLTSQGRNINAYLSSYSWAMLDPNRFTLPRRLYVGVSFGF